MDISSFHTLATKNGLKFIRQLNTCYQYELVLSDQKRIITIPDRSNIPDHTIRKLVNHLN